MRKKFSARAAALGMSGVLLTSALTGCTFGFASDLSAGEVPLFAVPNKPTLSVAAFGSIQVL